MMNSSDRKADSRVIELPFTGSTEDLSESDCQPDFISRELDVNFVMVSTKGNQSITGSSSSDLSESSDESGDVYHVDPLIPASGPCKVRQNIFLRFLGFIGL